MVATICLVIGSQPGAVLAQNNASDNTGGNVSDGGNSSDISGSGSDISGEGSDIGDGNGSDNTGGNTIVLSNSIQSSIEQLESGCGGECGTGNLSGVLDDLNALQDACASELFASTCSSELEQRLEDAKNQVQQILNQN
ncbi:MAG: hypothetical protein AAGD25_15980 [Cyanobacteria bacterium P01_F01_bin.150]